MANLGKPSNLEIKTVEFSVDDILPHYWLYTNN